VDLLGDWKRWTHPQSWPDESRSGNREIPGHSTFQNISCALRLRHDLTSVFRFIKVRAGASQPTGALQPGRKTNGSRSSFADGPGLIQNKWWKGFGRCGVEKFANSTEGVPLTTMWTSFEELCSEKRHRTQNEKRSLHVYKPTLRFWNLPPSALAREGCSKDWSNTSDIIGLVKIQ
jgi:hypothetical protein